VQVEGVEVDERSEGVSEEVDEHNERVTVTKIEMRTSIARGSRGC